ncbi:MAG: hypothetical protein DMF31_02595 [Verrucomicrobia bacterium]|nr:MAG: hypothetical protein DMF31_02595 [Verrucomicrobiota bacterium]
MRNRSLRFVCDMVITRVEVDDSPFTHGCTKGSLLRLPVAHGEGCFFADPKTLHDLNANEQVILRYADAQGRIGSDANPNGSIENIAGICNRERNVFGLMPHPDRASDARLGSTDGAKIFRSMMQTIRWLPTETPHDSCVSLSPLTSCPYPAELGENLIELPGRRRVMLNWTRGVPRVELIQYCKENEHYPVFG